MMPLRYHSMERKEQLLELLDPEHEVELDGTFLKHLATAIRASSPSEHQQALDKATEAYENALDDVLYENGGSCSEKQSTTPEGRRTPQDSSVADGLHELRLLGILRSSA